MENTEKTFKTPEKQRAATTKFRSRNKDYYAAYQLIYNADPLHRLIKNSREVTRRIKNKFLQNNKAYASDSAVLAVTGMNFSMLRFYLIQKFIEKYGHVPDLKREKYEIDHIIPLGSAKDEEELKILIRYTNIELVKAVDNRLKMQLDRQVIKTLNPKPRQKYTNKEEVTH